MKNLVVNVNGLLLKLDDDAFNRIKMKFQDHKDIFVIPKDHPMAAPLLQVLCDEKVFATLDRELFAQVIQAVIPDDALELKWLSNYCDYLLRSLGNVQQNTAKDARASQYADHLINKLIPEFKKGLQSASKKVRFIEPLSFIYKISACLLRCSVHNEYPFELSVNRSILSELGKNTFKLSVGIFESYSNEKRAFALFISWIVEEIICDQDGIGEV